jgi:hypothetical protein
VCEETWEGSWCKSLKSESIVVSNRLKMLWKKGCSRVWIGLDGPETHGGMVNPSNEWSCWDSMFTTSS